MPVCGLDAGCGAAFAVWQATEERRVAIVIAYGVHEDPALGDLLSKRATAKVTSGPFGGATIRNEHELLPGAKGNTIVFDVYLFY